jgi:hypothetical protein
VGKLILSLYEKDNDSGLANDNDVLVIPVLQPTPPTDGDDRDSSDSVPDPRTAAGFTAELDCRRTVMYCALQIRFGLSYRQNSSVIEMIVYTVERKYKAILQIYTR